MNQINCGCPRAEWQDRAHREVRFRCPACKLWHCGFCNGCDDQDFRYCDDCAARRRRRRERRSNRSKS